MTYGPRDPRAYISTMECGTRLQNAKWKSISVPMKTRKSTRWRFSRKLNRKRTKKRTNSPTKVKSTFRRGAPPNSPFGHFQVSASTRRQPTGAANNAMAAAARRKITGMRELSADARTSRKTRAATEQTVTTKVVPITVSLKSMGSSRRAAATLVTGVQTPRCKMSATRTAPRRK